MTSGELNARISFLLLRLECACARQCNSQEERYQSAEFFGLRFLEEISNLATFAGKLWIFRTGNGDGEPDINLYAK